MHIGVTIPRSEFGADLVGLRDFIQVVEDLGYAHLILPQRQTALTTSSFSGCLQ